MPASTTKTLRSLQDIRNYFRRRERACYFVSASNFNMMGMHQWVQGWRNINLLDCFDGTHPQVLVVPDNHSQAFESIQDINRYLLQDLSVQQLLNTRPVHQAPAQVLFLFFDEALEQLCAQHQLELILPPYQLAREVDSKIVTTEIGNQAGVPSVPNVLAKVSSYAQLAQLAQEAGLGQRWVVQTAYGDSGKTTYFIASEADYQAHASEIQAQERVKVMRWVRVTSTAIEACATRWGTFVGPLLSELIGVQTLTPYAGGWCGNELYQAAFSPQLRAQVQRKTQAMGEALYRRGYRGYFELDYLIDQDTQEVYLGELNARITGISAMTNMSDFSHDHVPLFLFHLLEYDAQAELQLDVQAFNQQVLQEGAAGVAAQLILKYTDEALQIVTQAPVSGVYQLGANGTLLLKAPGVERRAALAPEEAYVLRIMAVGNYAYHGADLAVLFLNQVVGDGQGGLNATGAQWVQALKASFAYQSLSQEGRAAVELAHRAVNVKSDWTT